MNKDTIQSLEELTENPPKGCAEIAHLYRWSTNYANTQGNPFQILLDMTGISQEEFGCKAFSGDDMTTCLGYMELEMLADAMKEYAQNPRDCGEYITALIHAEAE
jgi:hypothetical protein